MTRDIPFVLVLALALGVGASTLEGCVPVDSAQAQGPDAGSPRPIVGVDCVGLAIRHTGLTPVQTQQLCLGAPTSGGPIDCYLQAVRQLQITDDQAVLLCRCSPSREPVACWEHGRTQGRMLDDQLMLMCSPTLAMGLLPNCRTVGY